MKRNGYIKILVGCLLCMYTLFANAFSWQDLWQNADNRAQKLMQQGRYTEAQAQFKRDDWRATAAFRGKNYPDAAALFSGLNQADGYYNAGNAYAYQGQYEKAIQAYNKALTINKQNQDAVDNRRIVEDLLKKQRAKQQAQQNKQPQDQSNLNKQDSKQSDASSANQTDHPQRQSTQSQQNQQEAAKSPQEKNAAEENKAPSNASKDQKEEKEEKSQETPDKPEKSPEKTPENQPSSAKRDSKKNGEQQSTDQWLNMIPDDPGGLLREKFLRDYLRRRGES